MSVTGAINKALLLVGLLLYIILFEEPEGEVVFVNSTYTNG